VSTAPLSEDERQQAVAAFRRVFAADMANVDVYGEPFRADLPARAILYPVDPELDDDQLDALAAAADLVGDALRPLLVHVYGAHGSELISEILREEPPS
jgi:thiamine pyrophosphate-dependent acetolactate synthase large subunit-like protein